MTKRQLQALLNRFGLLHPMISARDRAASLWRRSSDRIRLAIAARSSRSPDAGTRHLIAVDPDFSRRTVEAVVGSDHRSVVTLRSNRELTMSLLERASVPFTLSGGDVLVEPSDRQRAIAAIADTGPTLYVLDLDTDTVTAGRRLGGDTAMHDRLVVFRYHADSTGAPIHGAECGCRIEFTSAASIRPETSYDFPIDVVYTWVDGSDPAWRLRRDAALEQLGHGTSHREATSEARFQSLDELRYSLRSLERYADFVRHVYVVTNGQSPPWLRTDHPDLTLVPHSEIFPDDALPTFNSHSIEACLHRIPDLSEHYLYLNDDFFFARRAEPGDYFDEQGRSRSFPSSARAPDGPVTASTRPVDAAAINVQAAVAVEFGVEVPNHKFKHTPYAQRRSVHQEIERRFPALIRQTIGARFRSRTDLAIASGLYQHVAELTGFGVTGELHSGYIDLGAPHLGERLRRLVESPQIHVYCLNDSDHASISADRKASLVRAHFEHVLPGPSRFER